MRLQIQYAFTLVELLVVIAIVGILSGLIIVSTSSFVQSAKIAKAKVFSASLRDSLMMNIVGEWKFEGPTAIDQTATVSDTVDSWGNNNTGIVINQGDQYPIVKSGNNCINGKCLNFSSSAYIACGTGGNDLNIQTGNAMTVEAWIKLDTLTGDLKTIVSKWWPWIFSIHPNGKLLFYIRTSSADAAVFGNTAIIPSVWYHVAVVYTKSELRATFYLNGIQDGNPIFSLPMVNDTSAHVGIAGYAGNSTTRFTGTIDEVRLYNVAIPASRIREHYYAGLNKLLSKKEIVMDKYSDILKKF